jgi:hypothetical protein
MGLEIEMTQQPLVRNNYGTIQPRGRKRQMCLREHWDGTRHHESQSVSYPHVRPKQTIKYAKGGLHEQAQSTPPRNRLPLLSIDGSDVVFSESVKGSINGL